MFRDCRCWHIQVSDSDNVFLRKYPVHSSCRWRCCRGCKALELRAAGPLTLHLLHYPLGARHQSSHWYTRLQGCGACTRARWSCNCVGSEASESFCLSTWFAVSRRGIYGDSLNLPRLKLSVPLSIPGMALPGLTPVSDVETSLQCRNLRRHGMLPRTLLALFVSNLYGDWIIKD